MSPNNDLTALTVGFVTIEDDLLNASETLAVELEFSRPLSADPSVTAEGIGLELVSNSAGRYRYELPIGDHGSDGVWELRVLAEDEIGQALNASVGQVTVDRIAPTVIGLARGAVLPGPQSLEPDGSDILGPGATVEVLFDVTESTASVEFLPSPAGSLSATSVQLSDTEFQATVSAVTSGAHTLAVRVTDRAGNSGICDPAAGCEVGPLSFLADLNPPTPPPVDTEGAVILTRRPNGGLNPVVSGALGEAFATTRVELFTREGLPLGDARTDEGGDFTVTLPVTDVRDVFIRTVNGAGTPSTRVRIRDGEWYGELDDKVAGDTSNPHRVVTSDFDDAVLRPDNLVELDDARYAALRGDGVTHDAAVRWENVTTRAIPGVARSARAAAFVPETGSVYIFGGYDGAITLGGLIRFNGRSYSAVETFGEVPSARDGATLTYVPTLNSLFLVGGLPDDAAPPSNEAWLFDLASRRWSRVANVPVGRWLHAAVYDPVRRQIAVVGGCRGPLCNGAAANGVLYPDPDDPAGILSDTVYWDPASNAWTDSGFSLYDAGVRGRCGHGLVFDSANGVILLVGGVNGIQRFAGATTGRWNGQDHEIDGKVIELTASGWTDLSDLPHAGIPSFRSATYYDPDTNRVYSFGGMRTGSGGSASDGTLHVWDRINRWVEVDARVSFERSDAFLYRDPRSDALTIVNGMRWASTSRSRFGEGAVSHEVEAASDAWALEASVSPAEWSQIGVAAAPGLVLPPVTRPGIAYDENRGRVVIYGGYEFLDAPYSTLREWTGAQWRTLEVSTSGQPSSRTEFAFFFDPCQQKLALSRGRPATGQSYQTFNGPQDSFLLDLSRSSFQWEPWNLTDSDPDGNPLPITRRHSFEMVMVENDCAGNDFYLEVGGLISDDVGRTTGGRFPSPDPTASVGFLLNPSGFVGLDAVFSVCNRDRSECGSAFEDVNPNVNARGWMAAARDPVRNVAVGFGGNAGSSGTPADSTDPQGRIFEWDPAGWDGSPQGATNSFRVFASDGTNGPVGLEAASMAYHLGMGRMLLFGGREVVDPGGFTPPAVTLYNDLWSWDGTEWQRINPVGSRPSPRAGAAMAYDEARGVMVMVGGDTRPHSGIEGFGGEVLSDTWELVFPVDERPSVTTFFNWSTSGVGAAEVTELTVTSHLAGQGNTRVVTASDTRGVPVSGASLLLYDHEIERWTDVATVTTDSAVEARSYSTDDPAVVAGLLGSAGFALKVLPLSNSGNGDTLGQVRLARPELRIRYRLAAESQ